MSLDSGAEVLRMSLPRRCADESGLTLQTAAPMIAASQALEIVLWNEGAEALLGFTESDVLGKRCWEVLECPPSARRCCCGGETREAAASERVPAFENEIATRSGERIWVGITTLLAGSGHDPPLRVHLLQALRRQRQLEELLRHVVSTASRVSSHDGHDGGENGRNGRSTGRTGPFLRGVTEREREVVRLLARGSSTAEIAALLGISPRTTRNHIQNILCKLHVHSRLEAVAYASTRGLV